MQGGLFRRSPVARGANIKIFREKVLLYTKLKGNIETFKNVTMAKYLRAQERIRNRDASVGVTSKLFFGTKEFSESPKARDKVLMFNITTNRGTCGALNARQAQNLVALAGGEYDIRTVVIGKKGKDSLGVLVPQMCSSSIIVDTDHSPTNAALIAQMLIEAQSTFQYKTIRINFTRWVSLARQDWAVVSFPSYDLFRSVVQASATAGDAPKGSVNNARLLNCLNALPEEGLRDFWEFHLMQAVNFCLEENVLSELASRIAAVDNQLQNIIKLRAWAQKMYNKTRQEKVTAELLELTSAAAAMEGVIAEEEAQKGGSTVVMTASDRAQWLGRVHQALMDMRYRIELAKLTGKVVPVSDLARYEKLRKWELLLSANEKTGVEGVGPSELATFLKGFAHTWQEDEFELRLNALRAGGSTPTLGGKVAHALAAAK